MSEPRSPIDPRWTDRAPTMRVLDPLGVESTEGSLQDRLLRPVLIDLMFDSGVAYGFSKFLEIFSRTVLDSVSKSGGSIVDSPEMMGFNVETVPML